MLNFVRNKCRINLKHKEIRGKYAIKLTVSTPSLLYGYDFTIKIGNENYDASNYEAKGVSEGVFMTNITNAANYMVKLFFNCGQKYSCNRTKLEKLLSIADIISMKKNSLLFQDHIVIKSCGVGILNIPLPFQGDIIFGSQDEDDTEIPLSEIENILKRLEGDNDNMDAEDRRLIVSVFRRFGNYKPSTLGPLIDKFKDVISTPNPDSDYCYIDSSKVLSYFSCKQDLYDNNVVFKFIFDY